MDIVNECLADESRKRHVVESLIKRSQLNPSTGCTEWTSAKTSFGYGRVSCGREFNNMRAHRLSWAIVNGPIPEDMCICHSCDNPSCINPDHLFLGTKLDNTADMVSKGRHFTPFKEINRVKENPELAARGEANGNSILTEDIVRQIRSFPGGLDETAEKFGIGRTTAWRVKTYRSWKHVS